MKTCPTCKNEYASGEVFCPVDGSRLSSPSAMVMPAERDASDPLVGQTLKNTYKVLRRIGEGGMGMVYEAVHVVIEKHVAVKVLRDDFTSRTDVVERFRQEAKSASRIGHEHIVDISDFGELPTGQSYFVMEMLSGHNLADVLHSEQTLAPKRAAKIVIQCCRALGAAHSKGIVHRDMKPENIFLISREGEPDFVKIVDFGIAKMSDVETTGAPGRKLTKTGMIFGTPEYMSPEQAAGKSLDHRVDIYALGVILFEVLTGRVPFVGDSFMGVLTQHMFESPPALRTVNPHAKVSPEIEAVIYKALAKDPNERYQTTDELARALQNAMDLTGDGLVTGGTLVGFGEPVKAKAAAPTPQPLRINAETMMDAAPAGMSPAPAPAKSGRGGLIAGVVVVLLALGGIGGYAAIRATSTPDAHGNGNGELPNGGIGSAPPGGHGPTTDPHNAINGTDPVLVDAGGAAVLGVTADDAGPGQVVPVGAFVRVITVPPQAIVTVASDGARARACAPSPCRITGEPAAHVRLHAELRQGARLLVGESDGVVGGGDITITLAVRPRRPPTPNGQPHSPNPVSELHNPFLNPR